MACRGCARGVPGVYRQAKETIDPVVAMSYYKKRLAPWIKLSPALLQEYIDKNEQFPISKFDNLVDFRKAFHQLNGTMY